MKIKLDENLGLAALVHLRAAGHDVHGVHDEDLVGAADETVYAAIRAEDRFLVTMDTDFADPFRFPPEPTAGVAVLRLGQPTAAHIRAALDRLLASATQVPFAGRLRIVDDRRVRVFTRPSSG